MCGIVAFNGKLQAQDCIIQGLEKLEYRGYDSAGVALIEGEKIFVCKSTGKLENLKNRLVDHSSFSHIGIGHTRWATHGIPNEANAHPHLDNKGEIALVHNGIIENYLELKTQLEKEGFTFRSQTDSEVIVNLLSKFYKGNLLEAVDKVRQKLRGSFSLAIISSCEPDTLVLVRRESPLVLGITKDGILAASDVPAILSHTRQVIYLEDEEIVEVKDGKYQIFKDKLPIEKEVSIIEWDLESASKEGFEHFMLKEIYDQPKVISDCLKRKISSGFVDIEDGSFSQDQLNGFDKIFISACGTSFHAAEAGKRVLEKALNKEIGAEIASEFRYYMPFLNEKSLLIVLSQSGETGDTLAVLREAKKRGATVLAITNVLGSSIDREADKVLYCDAGPEISVASTKAYTTQLLSLYILSLDFGYKLGNYTEEYVRETLALFSTLPKLIRKVLDQRDRIKEIAHTIANKKSLFFIGRGLDYLSAKEGALKLKEISYLNTLAIASGELKHGSIALIEEASPVISLLTQKDLLEKSVSNIKEVKARGAYVLAILSHEIQGFDKLVDHIIEIPSIDDLYMPILSVLPQQLLAYEISLSLGKDIDKPRNLAKSVTVE